MGLGQQIRYSQAKIEERCVILNITDVKNPYFPSVTTICLAELVKCFALYIASAISRSIALDHKQENLN